MTYLVDANVRSEPKLLSDLRNSGEWMLIKDSLIAATALQHGLIVVTRNVRDFKKARVKVVDPFP